MTDAGGSRAGSTVFGCSHTSDDDPCPAQTLYERAYPQSASDLYGWTRFHHGWHAQDADLAQARARIEVLGRVDEAAREYSYNGHVPPCRVEYRHCTCGYTDLLQALDAAQPSQQPQHPSETTPALGDLQSHGPREDAPEH